MVVCVVFTRVHRVALLLFRSVADMPYSAPLHTLAEPRLPHQPACRKTRPKVRAVAIPVIDCAASGVGEWSCVEVYALYSSSITAIQRERSADVKTLHATAARPPPRQPLTSLLESAEEGGWAPIPSLPNEGEAVS